MRCRHSLTASWKSLSGATANAGTHSNLSNRSGDILGTFTITGAVLRTRVPRGQ